LIGGLFIPTSFRFNASFRRLRRIGLHEDVIEHTLEKFQEPFCFTRFDVYNISDVVQCRVRSKIPHVPNGVDRFGQMRWKPRKT
jgi:hypothetical protein